MDGAGTVDIKAAIDSQGRSAFGTLILLTCSAVMVVEGYDAQVVGYAAPAIIRAWHLERSSFGPVFGASLFGYMLGATILSGASDRFGRKRVIAASNLAFALFTIASAFATTITGLISFRLLAGLGLGCSIPATIALAVEFAPEQRRAFRVSLLFVGYTVGAAFGGMVAAALMTWFGWQSAFLLGACLSIAAVLAAFALLPESVWFLAARGTRPDQIASIMRRLRPDLGITSATRFVLAEEKVHKGLPVTQLFTDGRAWMTVLLWAAFVTSLASHYFLTSWIPTVLDAGGIPLAHAVVAGSLIQAGGGLGSLGVGRMVDRFGMLAIAVAFMLAVPLVALIGAVDWSEPVLMAIVFLTGICLLGGQIGLNALASTIYPTAARSSGAGWALGVGRFGSIMGPVIGGWLIGAGLSTPALFVCAAIPAGLSGMFVFLLSRASSQPQAVRQLSRPDPA